MNTVASLKNEVSGILQGINLETQVTNLNGALERASRELAIQADVPEVSGIYPFEVYGQVYDYPAPEYIFGTAINDLRVQGINRNPQDYAYKQPPELFDRMKGWLPSGFGASFDFRNGTYILRVTSAIPKQCVVIDPMNQIGNWAVGGTASGLAVDQTNYWAAPASLRFSQTVGVGTLTETLAYSIDLSDYEGVGVAFLAIDTPLATELSSIELRLGSDSANYASVTATTGFVGNWWANDWLQVAFDFANATNVGTPDWSAIQYVQVRVTSTDTLTNFRAGYLQIGLPTPVELLYQSSAVFMPAGTNTPLNTITLDTDYILYNDAAYTIYTYECARAIYLQSGGGLSDKMYQTLTDKLNNPSTGLYTRYVADNPSQELRAVDYYY